MKTLAAIVLLAATTAGAQQLPPRTAVRGADEPVSGRAVIAGHVVTDDASRQPVRHALVTVADTETPFRRTVITDDTGAFSITAIPAGRYLLHASKAGYVRTAFGGGRADAAGTPIALVDGQRAADVTIAIVRGSAISGAVTDETGLPAFGVTVHALKRERRGGIQRLALPVSPESHAVTQTDDRGLYRFYGLSAGDYAVVATPFRASGPDLRVMTQAEISAALQELRQAPGSAMPSSARATATSDVTTVDYSPVFYPGVTTAAAAGVITVSAGEDRTGIDVALQLLRTSRIEGTVTTPAGIAPESVRLVMTPADAGPEVDVVSFIRSAGVSRAGDFSFVGVPPGRYLISASTGVAPIMAFGDGVGMFTSFPGPRLMGQSAVQAEPTEALWGQSEVTVSGGTVANVIVALQPGMTLSGRVVMDDQPGRRPPPASILLFAENGSQAPNAVLPARLNPDGTFTISGIGPGRYRLSMQGLPEGNQGPAWTLKSATVAGRDVLDLPLDIGSNDTLTGAVLTVTTKTQAVAGAIQDAGGRPASNYTIVLFPADRRYWTSFSRRILTARSGTDGRFTIANPLPGSYRLAAVLDVGSTDVQDPELLEQLLGGSLPISVTEGQSTIQNLRIGGGS